VRLPGAIWEFLVGHAVFAVFCLVICRRACVHAARSFPAESPIRRTLTAWTGRRVHAVSTLDQPDIRRRGWTAWTTPVRVSSHVSVQAAPTARKEFFSFLVARLRTRPVPSRVAMGPPFVSVGVGRDELLEVGARPADTATQALAQAKPIARLGPIATPRPSGAAGRVATDCVSDDR
jgi:hypothetical protein